MATPTAGELQAALIAIQQAAEAVKVYDQEVIAGVEAAIAANVDTIRQAESPSADANASLERILKQCTRVGEGLSRARQYPEQIMARAAVLDQIGGLARVIRESLPLMASSQN
jgi:hypothetical protein